MSDWPGPVEHMRTVGLNWYQPTFAEKYCFLVKYLQMKQCIAKVCISNGFLDVTGANQLYNRSAGPAGSSFSLKLQEFSLWHS